VRVILLKGGSAYDVVDRFVDGVAGALARRGCQPDVIDVTQTPDLGGALAQASSAGPPGFVFSFGLFGEYRSADGRSIGEIAGAPHVIQYLDYPLSHGLRLDRTPRSSAILVVDESHAEAIEAVYGAGHFAHVGFSPHGAVGEAAPGEADADAFAAARPIPILFAGTFYGPGEPVWAGFSPELRRVFDDAYEIAMASDWTPALDALRQALAAHGADPSAPHLREVRKGATFIHEQVRRRRREQLFEAAAEAGVQLFVVGAGFETELERFPNLIHGGAGDIGQVAELMRRSRVVLNINANFGAGSHERPLSAMLAGAVAATDQSRFYAARFHEGEEILTWRWSAPGEGLSTIAKVAADPEAAFPIAAAGRARAEAEHLWDHRLDAILRAAEAARRAPTG
jgi:hypothetical protein